MKSFLPEGDLLTWEPRDDGSVRGFVASHPRVTLFIVTKQPPAAGAEIWQLTGAVMPDDGEKSSHSLETAKYHAEGYWRGWIDQMCVPHVSFLASPLLETLRDTAQQIHDATGQQLPAEAECEVRVHCGGLVSVQYNVGCGDSMGKGLHERKFAWGASPKAAGAAMIEQIDRSQLALKIREAHLRSKAAELGFELVRKKGAR